MSQVDTEYNYYVQVDYLDSRGNLHENELIDVSSGTFAEAGMNAVYAAMHGTYINNDFYPAHRILRVKPIRSKIRGR